MVSRGSKLGYYLQLDPIKLQGSLDAEAYPKAGAPNPIVNLFVYDLATRRSTRVDVRDGQPFTNDVVGHYVYRIEWSPDGRELTVHRTNRRQNALEFAACHPGTGSCRVIVREERPASWVTNHPPGSTWPTAGASSGSRSGRAGGTSTCMTWRVSSWPPSRTTSSQWPTS